MIDRCFTPHSARRALERVRPTIERVCRLYRQLETAEPGPIQSDLRVEPRYFALLEKLHASLSEVTGQGVQVKDLKQGLIDFPARREGRMVLLCWRVGEPALAYWHEVDAGFRGRRPLRDDGLWDEEDAERRSSG